MTATQAGQPAQDPDDGPAARGRDMAHVAPVVFSRADETTGTAAQPNLRPLRSRLITPMPDDRLWGWIGPLLVTLFAGFLRFYRLSVPNAVIFDETYYAKDAWSILKHGVEWNIIPDPRGNDPGTSTT